MGHNNNNIRELQSGSVVKSSTSFLAWLNLLPAKENYSPAPIWAYANSRTEKIALTGLLVCIAIFLGFIVKLNKPELISNAIAR